MNNPDQQLTVREREVAVLVGLGYSYQAIATDLDISMSTVTTHINNMARKLQGRGTPIRKVMRWAMNEEDLPKTA